jgi:hypothetical protein
MVIVQKDQETEGMHVYHVDAAGEMPLEFTRS